MSENTPEEMISVKDYARRQGMTVEEVILQIRDGELAGKKIENNWFVSLATEAPQTRPSAASYTFGSDYQVARTVSQVVSLVGWLVVILGIFLAAFSAIQEFELLAVLAAVGVAVSGILVVAAGQITRATVDNAGHTRGILTLLRQRLQKHS